MKNKKNVPDIRFKGFNCDWKQSTLGEIYNFKYGQFNNNPSNGGFYPVYGANGIIGGYTEYNAENSVIIGHMGEYAGSVLWGEGRHFVTYNGTITRPKNCNLNCIYGYYMLYSLNINKRCGGGGLPFLSYDQLNKLKSFFSGNTGEQQAIGNYFQNIDRLINTSQTKLDKLKNIKKACLEKMFPRNGSTTPELRFKGFIEEWKEQQLGDCADIVGGGTPDTANSEYWDGDIDWYSPAEIGDKIFIDRSKRKITQLGLKESSAKVLPIGTVLFSSRAGIGSTAILAKEGATNQGFQSIIPHNGKLDTYFIFSRTRELKKYGETNGAGSTFIEVSGKQMESMPIINPEIDEQKAIGIFFKNLDRLIAKTEQQINKLKNIKKACLDKMFVNTEDKI